MWRQVISPSFNCIVGGTTRRSRKQFFWFVCVISGIFLFYFNFAPSKANSQNVDEQHRPRSLHAVEGQEGSRYYDPGNKVAQRVQFIENDYHVQNKISNNGAAQTYNIKNNDLQEDTDQNGYYRETERERSKESEAQSLLEQRLRNQQQGISVYEVPPQKEEQRLQQSDNDEMKENVEMGNSEPWMGGNLRYNNFGEPQYDHRSRPLYIPKQRVVHLDLKGAPPKASILVKLMPWLAKNGATTVLLEYEDMFPWDGTLAPLAAKNHYSKKEVRMILEACKNSNLQVIPLVQTFGHLEYALKGGLFSYLREVPEIPQALCPSHNDTSLFVRAMIDQIMKMHPHVRFLHIGCDEVFQLGECDKCRQRNREDLFLKHVSDTASYVLNAYDVKPLIWHDMITHFPSNLMMDYKFGELVEPMVWVYAEDVYRFVTPSHWSILAEVFPYVWAASAFKGAFGEQETTPNVRRHLDNNLNWLDVMVTENSKFTGGFRGLVLTGWQRFDHFAVLCETFPVAMPSLAVNLISVTHGFFNSTIEPKIEEALKCVQKTESYQNTDLDNDPFLFERFSWCFFPGAQAFKLTARLRDIKKEVRDYIEKVKNSRGWITDYNLRHNFSSPMRIDQDLEDLPLKLQLVEMLVKSARDSFSDWFDGWTTGEWIEQHLWPLINKLRQLEAQSLSMKSVKTWPPRPLPLPADLGYYNVTEPPIVKRASKKKRNQKKSSTY